MVKPDGGRDGRPRGDDRMGAGGEAEGWAAVCGLTREATLLRGVMPAAVVAGDAGRARQAADAAIANGALGLVSFGLCGGLAPEARPGTVILADRVVLRDGGPVPTSRARLLVQDRCTAAGLPTMVGPLFGSDDAIADVSVKAMLYTATRALAVDMESHGVALAARAGHVPVLVVRVVADGSRDGIPPYALAGLGPDGEMRPWPVVAGWARRPWTLPALLRLARRSGRAFDTLRRLAPMLTALDAAAAKPEAG